MKMEAEIGMMRPQPRNAGSHQELEEAGRILPQSLQREHRPADPSISDF